MIMTLAYLKTQKFADPYYVVSFPKVVIPFNGTRSFSGAVKELIDSVCQCQCQCGYASDPHPDTRNSDVCLYPILSHRMRKEEVNRFVPGMLGGGYRQSVRRVANQIKKSKTIAIASLKTPD
jgi:hypothetical protein